MGPYHDSSTHGRSLNSGTHTCVSLRDVSVRLYSPEVKNYKQSTVEDSGWGGRRRTRGVDPFDYSFGSNRED